MTRGFYVGSRRIMLSAQVDDFFLNTITYGVTSDDPGVRIEPSDLEFHANFTHMINQVRTPLHKAALGDGPRDVRERASVSASLLTIGDGWVPSWITVFARGQPVPFRERVQRLGCDRGARDLWLGSAV